MKRILLITIICVSFLGLEAQTITWTGAGDGTNWSDYFNWDRKYVPADFNDVIIPNGSTVTLDEDALINSLNIQGPSLLTINHSLSINESSFIGENTTVNWHYGSISGSGPLTLENEIITNFGIINIDRPAPSFDTPTILGVTFNNEGILNIINGTLITGTSSVLNNQSQGMIDLGMVDFPLGNGILCCGLLNNWGTIRKDKGINVSNIGVDMYNFGTIQAMSGTIKFNYLSALNAGTIEGTSVVDFSEVTNFENPGVFSPGASTGSLTFIGDFTSLPSSTLKVELEGLYLGIDYDLLEIQGDAIFDGDIEVSLSFDGAINDEFIVAITTGVITSCSLQPNVITEFNGNQYFFDVACRNNNEIVLTITNITLGLNSNEFNENSIEIYPNPATSKFRLRNNSKNLLNNIEILDFYGRIMENISLDTTLSDYEISLFNYTPGLYFIKINSNNNYIIKKIIIR